LNCICTNSHPCIKNLQWYLQCKHNVIWYVVWHILVIYCTYIANKFVIQYSLNISISVRSKCRFLQFRNCKPERKSECLIRIFVAFGCVCSIRIGFRLQTFDVVCHYNNITTFHLSDCYSYLKDYIFSVLPHHTALLDWTDMKNNEIF